MSEQDVDRGYATVHAATAGWSKHCEFDIVTSSLGLTHRRDSMFPTLRCRIARPSGGPAEFPTSERLLGLVDAIKAYGDLSMFPALPLSDLAPGIERSLITPAFEKIDALRIDRVLAYREVETAVVRPCLFNYSP
jgi:hypothetical protein